MAALLLLGLLVLGGSSWMMFAMPGESFHCLPRPLDSTEETLRERLEAHVRVLAEEIGERHYWRPERLRDAADHVAGAFREAGYEPIHHAVPTYDTRFDNIEVRLPGRDDGAGALVIGAHYDTVRGSPGADDNASGVAVLIELARLLEGAELGRGVRLVAFVNEEEPFFGSEAMGSLHYARRAREHGEAIMGMISLEMLGYYCHDPGCQAYPPLLGYLYPEQGAFVAFVGNLASRQLVRRAIGAFREHARVPSEGLVSPELLRDIRRSDHWAFWQLEHPAMMLTDTANFRNPHYHAPSDTPERLDYATMARLTSALARAVETLARR
jgi:nitroreductase